jgi:hypothetical protein
MKPYDFKWTKFYESNTDFPYTGLQIDLVDNELFICSTFIDKENFSILTTRRLLTQKDGQLCSENMQGATDKFYGDFKGYSDQDFTFGSVQLPNGNEIKYFIEIGKASMVMIYGVRTLISINEMIQTREDTIGKP